MKVKKEVSTGKRRGRPLKPGNVKRVGKREKFGATQEIAVKGIGKEKKHAWKVVFATESRSKNEHRAGRKKRTKTVAKKKINLKGVTKAKRLQTNWDIYKKVKSLDLMRTSKTKAHVAKIMCIPQSTLRGWLKDEVRIRKEYHHHVKEKEPESAKPTPPSACELQQPLQMPVISPTIIQKYLHAVLDRHMRKKPLMPSPPSTISTKNELQQWLEEQRTDLESSIDSIYLCEVHRLYDRIQTSFRV